MTRPRNVTMALTVEDLIGMGDGGGGSIFDTELTEDEFMARFKPMRGNHTGDQSSGTGLFGDCYFECHGKDEEYVTAYDSNRIWTLVDGERPQDVVLISGLHFVNRCGYLIATVPTEPGHSYFVNMPGEDDDEGEVAA
jgi:hypothetical protein